MGTQLPQRVNFVVVGDGGCGKTCLLFSYVNQALPEYIPRVFYSYVAELEINGREVEMAFWDTVEGQEEYDRLRPLSYQHTHVLLLCFSISSRDSFESIQKKWIGELDAYCKNVPIVLVGCKSDLREDKEIIKELQKTMQKPIEYQEALDAAKSIEAVKYVECSAKSNEGVQDVFEQAAAAALLNPKARKRLKGNKKGCIFL
ncbi:GTP-binding protein Rho1 [Basidiobolus ranarum]|uniref:GTP-binding protein Rho1 n=1 Tax=Basidiobolus ranarum TaxID=34480 RepID=A0ABR2WGH7_9FUNG